MKTLQQIALITLLATSAQAWAQSHGEMTMDKPATAMGAASDMAMSDGVVRKVDKSTGKVTLKHGEIRNLDMPPMTMVFRVKEPALLDKVKAGDKVRFTADEIRGNLTLVTIEPVKP
jgi:Cu/Ag efflux protein CusF